MKAISKRFAKLRLKKKDEKKSPKKVEKLKTVRTRNTEEQAKKAGLSQDELDRFKPKHLRRKKK